ncbi:MAG: T9SS type A sorting domain-containing protein [Bacteroidales bacterium]|nr:T9SS type A sorting domain-containing protein [Bacteroidales bacterium]
MRRLILILMILLPCISRAQTLIPEHTWHDNNSDKGKWYTAQMGSTVGSYNGYLYAFNYRDDGNYNGGHTYMFRVNQNNAYTPMTPYKLGPSRSYKLIFGYDNESSSFDPAPMRGKTFCFQFNQRLWYFQHAKNKAGEHENDKNESYECFAQMPLDTMADPFVYYNKNSPPPDLTKMGAFQYDSNLYFLAINTNSDASNYNKWAVQEYSYNSSTNKFSHVRDTYIPQLLNYQLGGIIRRLDYFGNEYFVVTTYVPNGGTGVYRLTPVISSGYTQFTVTYFAPVVIPITAATTLVEGSIKGNKTSDALPQYSDRFCLYSINQDASSDGTHHIAYNEFYVLEDTLGNTQVSFVNKGEITIPTSTAPNKGAGSYYQLVGTYQLIPHHFTNAFDTDSTSTYDGFIQYVWLFYPDKNKNFNGINLQSDNWRLTSDPIVLSSDLNDTISYPGIKDLWSLIGICDNGPPCSVDWDAWYDPNNTYHAAGTDPTELEFTVTAGKESEVANTYEDQWSIGQSLELSKGSKKLQGSFSEDFKYCQTYKNTVATSHEVKTTYTQTFGLSDETQGLAALLWAIPEITRYPFCTFAWWDTQLAYPVPNSDQYLFRMSSIAIRTQYVPIDSYPFHIINPNDSTFQSWTFDARDTMQVAINNNGLSPICHPTWDSPGDGQAKTYEITSSSTDSYEQSMEYEVTAGLSVKVPKVFSVGVSGSYKVNYTTESSVTDKFGTEIKCSLANLNSVKAGTKISSLDISTYWFRNNNGVNWWYYQYFGDQRPWYIAYIVNPTKAEIQLLSPQNHAVTDNKNLFFNWEDEYQNLSDYELLISKSSPIDNTTIIYKQSAGDAKASIPSGFQPEVGITYYWAVRGKSQDGNVVTSDIYSFTMGENDERGSESSLKAFVYPNPGKSSDVHIVADSKMSGKIRIVIYDLNGSVKAKKEIVSNSAVPVDFSCAGLDLAPGLYVSMISNGNEKVVRKIIIN